MCTATHLEYKRNHATASLGTANHNELLKTLLPPHFRDLGTLCKPCLRKQVRTVDYLYVLPGTIGQQGKYQENRSTARGNRDHPHRFVLQLVLGRWQQRARFCSRSGRDFHSRLRTLASRQADSPHRLVFSTLAAPGQGQRALELVRLSIW